MPNFRIFPSNHDIGHCFIFYNEKYYGFKLFKIIGDQIYDYFDDKIVYKFKNFKVDNSLNLIENNIKFHIPTVTEFNGNLKGNTLIINLKKIGYKVDSLFFLASIIYYSKFENLYLTLVEFEKSDIEFFDGTDLLVSNFNIPSPETVELVLKLVDAEYERVYTNYESVLKKTIIDGHQTLFNLINNNN